MSSRKPWLPWALGALFVMAVVAPALDPDQQLFFRDTVRLYYPMKQFVAAQLRGLHSPFWDPWAASGTSVLGQIAPGILHPFTLLYFALPFETAFKLNCLFVVPLAWTGLYLLARKTGASVYGAAAGACGYAASGYLMSVVSSNLPYALGAATVPLALHGLLRLVERPSFLRLLWAGFALASTFLAGEPESMLLAGVIGAVWVVGAAVQHRLSRRTAAAPSPRTRAGVVGRLGLVCAWGACAVLLAAPAILPALASVRTSTRQNGPTAAGRAWYSNRPVRLLGLLVPYAFDDEEEVEARNTSPYGEYFAKRVKDGPQDAFAESIVLGAPILLLAIAAGRRGLYLVTGGVVLLLASTGESFGVLRLLELIVPGLARFRYAEKLVAPGAMLLCLGAALGGRSLSEKPGFVLRLALGCGAVVAAAWLGLRLSHDAVLPWLERHGRTGAPLHAATVAAALDRGLRVEAIAAVALAAVAFAKTRRATVPAQACAAMLCAAAGFWQTRGVLRTESLDAIHAPVLLGEELTAVAGPSEGRWRIRADTRDAIMLPTFALRTSRLLAMAQLLNPQFNALAGIESVSGYLALEDADYLNALLRAPAATNQVLGVRFDVKSPYDLRPEHAQATGYRAAAFGAWVKQFPERPRAFIARCARAARERDQALALLAGGRFHVDEAVLREEVALPCPGTAGGSVSLDRTAPDRMIAHTTSPGRALLVVAEHYDRGWRATVDGKPAKVLQADLSAVSVVVPAGTHEVALHFVPPFWWLGIGLCAACAAALSGGELLQRKHRVGPAEAE